MDLNLEELLRKEFAVKFVESLPPDEKVAILAKGVERVLEKLEFKWEVEKVLKAEAVKFAVEYVKQPDVQQRLRNKAVRVVETFFEELTKLIGKELEDLIKSRYRRILSEVQWNDET